MEFSVNDKRMKVFGVAVSNPFMSMTGPNTRGLIPGSYRREHGFGGKDCLLSSGPIGVDIKDKSKMCSVTI